MCLGFIKPGLQIESFPSLMNVPQQEVATNIPAGKPRISIMKPLSMPRLLVAALSLPYAYASINCAGTVTIKSAQDVKALQDCASFSGEVVLDSSLRGEDINLNGIQWAANASITSRDCGTDCPEYEYSYGPDGVKFNLSCDARTLHDIKLHGLPLHHVEFPKLKSIHDLVVTWLPALSFSARDLQDANAFRFVNNLFLTAINVAPEFSAGTPESHLPEAGLEIRNSSEIMFFSNNLLKSQRPCGDIYISDTKSMKVNFPLRASGDVYFSVYGGSRPGGTISFADSNVTEYADCNQTFSRSITLEGFASVQMYKTEVAAATQHRVGTFKLTNVGSLSDRVIPLYFKDVYNLVIINCTIENLRIIPSRWKKYHLDTMIIDSSFESTSRSPGIASPDDDDDEADADATPFYWPQLNIKRLEYRGDVLKGFFDSFIHPEDFTNSSMWERASRPKVQHMVVEIVIEKLDCKDADSGVASSPLSRLPLALAAMMMTTFVCIL